MDFYEWAFLTIIWILQENQPTNYIAKIKWECISGPKGEVLFFPYINGKNNIELYLEFLKQKYSSISVCKKHGESSGGSTDRSGVFDVYQTCLVNENQKSKNSVNMMSVGIGTKIVLGVNRREDRFPEYRKLTEILCIFSEKIFQSIEKECKKKKENQKAFNELKVAVEEDKEVLKEGKNLSVFDDAIEMQRYLWVKSFSADNQLEEVDSIQFWRTVRNLYQCSGWTEE